MTRRSRRWQDHKGSNRAHPADSTIAGPCTVTKADGSVEIIPALTANDPLPTTRTRAEAKGRQPRAPRGPRAARIAGRRQLHAHFDSHCSDCGRRIHEGDPISWSPIDKTAWCQQCSGHHAVNTRTNPSST